MLFSFKCNFINTLYPLLPTLHILSSHILCATILM
nr:MAG TPA: hypothetical protein [Bacteriophage sp.]DAS41515.1 MAG TPA: hypothetical protein [Bacteriophage sp.]